MGTAVADRAAPPLAKFALYEGDGGLVAFPERDQRVWECRGRVSLTEIRNVHRGLRRCFRALSLGGEDRDVLGDFGAKARCPVLDPARRRGEFGLVLDELRDGRTDRGRRL